MSRNTPGVSPATPTQWGQIRREQPPPRYSRWGHIKGEQWGHFRVLQPPHRSEDLAGVSLLRFGADGLVVKERDFWNHR